MICFNCSECGDELTVPGPMQTQTSSSVMQELKCPACTEDFLVDQALTKSVIICKKCRSKIFLSEARVNAEKSEELEATYAYNILMILFLIAQIIGFFCLILFI